jgi:hypothetical protein
MAEFSVSHFDGDVLVTNGEFVSTMHPDDARKLARMLLVAAEGAQIIRSLRGDGMPERITLDEMRGLG